MICLCAEWCGTCREFRDAFLRIEAADASGVYHWVDIEDHEDDLDDVEVENFPTIVIADGSGRVQFAGPILPQFETLRRLCAAARAGELRATDADEWSALVRRLKLRDDVA